MPESSQAKPEVGAARSYISRARGFVRLAAILVLTTMMAAPVLLLSALHSPIRFVFLRWFYQILNRIVGLRVTVRGEPTMARPTLYAANHVSYLDVVILGSLVKASFVSKADVASWPAIGFFARQVRTAFIERDARLARLQVRELCARLVAGDSLVLFPEGTASDGCGVLPFKSSLFAALPDRAHPVAVQPVSVVYRSDHLGRALSYDYRLRYAWTNEMPDELFGQHAWDMLCSPGLGVQVIFHAPLRLREMPGRKTVAAECQARISPPILAAREAV